MDRPRLLMQIAGGALLVFAALFVAVAVHREPLPLDGALRDLFQDVGTPDARALVEPVARLGSREVLVPVLLLGGGLLSWQRRTPGPLALLVGSYLGMVLLVGPTKRILHRPEPFDVAGDIGRSFPSGHAAQAVLVYGMLAALLAAGPVSRRARAAAAIGATALCAGIGVAMMVRNAHWMSDMVGGYAAGVAWLAGPLAVAGRAAPHLLGITPGGPSGRRPEVEVWPR